MTAQIGALAQALEADFEQHPDAVVVRSLPGLGTILGARVLGEFGDEPDRYLTAKSRKNYAGTSPVHPRLRHQTGRAGPPHPQRPPRRRPLPLGLRRPDRLTRRPPLLRPAPRRRRHPPLRPCAPWATASSASCTAAWPTTPPTTKSPPGATEPRTKPPPQLDSYGGGISNQPAPMTRPGETTPRPAGILVRQNLAPQHQPATAGSRPSSPGSSAQEASGLQRLQAAGSVSRRPARLLRHLVRHCEFPGWAVEGLPPLSRSMVLRSRHTRGASTHLACTHKNLGL